MKTALIVTATLALTAALTLTGALTGPAHAAPGGPIDIVNNRGGNVVRAIERRERLARSGRQVRIKGACDSACTIWITLPNACLDPRATVGFHAPRIPNTTIIPPIVDQLMGEFYRGGIRERWFGGWNRSLKINRISARDYVRLDPRTRLCR